MDGLGALRAEIGLKEIALLIERTARWVSPEIFKLLPVWFPEHARGRYFYKANWSEPQMNRRGATGVALHWTESNTYANKALSLALGLRTGDRPNWSCCHIWGIDDSTSPNVVVQDRRFYSCVANMVLLPTPLKAFTDTMPDVKAMLRICARNLYGWQCDHDAMKPVNAELERWSDWNSYPTSWPRTPDDQKVPLGVVELTPAIKRSARVRLSAIQNDLKDAGPFFPRQEVVEALAYWKISAEPSEGCEFDYHRTTAWHGRSALVLTHSEAAIPLSARTRSSPAFYGVPQTGRL